MRENRLPHGDATRRLLVRSDFVRARERGGGEGRGAPLAYNCHLSMSCPSLCMPPKHGPSQLASKRKIHTMAGPIDSLID